MSRITFLHFFLLTFSKESNVQDYIIRLHNLLQDYKEETYSESEAEMHPNFSVHKQEYPAIWALESTVKMRSCHICECVRRWPLPNFTQLIQHFYTFQRETNKYFKFPHRLVIQLYKSIHIVNISNKLKTTQIFKQ